MTQVFRPMRQMTFITTGALTVRQAFKDKGWQFKSHWRLFVIHDP